jgi:hypothetical protein
MSVPARIGAWMSASAEVRVKRGSTWMTLAPRALACITNRKAIGCASAMFEPMTSTTSEFFRFHCGIVAAPRPNDAPSDGTEFEWQTRAWFSIQTMPSPPENTFLMR